MERNESPANGSQKIAEPPKPAAIAKPPSSDKKATPDTLPKKQNGTTGKADVSW